MRLLAMIVGIGTDIVEIARFEKIYVRYGQRFLEKIFSAAELQGLSTANVATLAGRFAAKEAAVKALGTGFAGGIAPQQVEIRRNQDGSAQIAFVDKAGERARVLGVKHNLLSISHERSMALAVVVLED